MRRKEEATMVTMMHLVAAGRLLLGGTRKTHFLRHAASLNGREDTNSRIYIHAP
jgi:hypothetical protein